MLHKKTFAVAVCSLALLCISSAAKSQNINPGFWDVLNLEYYLNQKWNLWGEAQVRSQKLTDQFYYHELKSGVNYRPNKNLAILSGIGQFVTFSNGANFKSPVLSNELRLWEQLTVVNNIDRLKIEHRLRIEQRWLPDDYRNRVRYRLNPVIPINKRTIEKGTLFASIYDEIFLTNKGRHFERNRVSWGLGYQFSSPFKLQIGWIRQFDYLRNNTVRKGNFLQTTLSFRINQHKSDHNVHVGSMD